MAASLALLALVALQVALGDLAVRTETPATPSALWATISENKSHVKPLYASMAGDHPASGKNWSSKPKEQVNAWNRTMQHTYHTYIPSSYQKLPSKAADIRASSAASEDEQKFNGYSSQYGGLARVAMRGAKQDFHQRSPSHGAGTPDHQYADRYASSASSKGTAYESYLKDYAGSEKGQDGEKYMRGSGARSSAGPDYQQFMNKYANDQSKAGSSNRDAPQESYKTYMRGGGSSSWDKQYGHSSGWKQQLSGVVPSFVPRFNAKSMAQGPPGTGSDAAKALGPTTANGVDAEKLPSAQDGLQQWCWLGAASLGSFALMAGVRLSNRRTVHPPEDLLG